MPAMRKNQKIITTILWSFLVLTMVAVVGRGMWRTDSDPAARGVSAAYEAPTGPGGLPILYDAPHFTLIDQDGKPFDSEQLKGNVWVAAFIFTNCPGVCPMMTTRMVKLQDAVPSNDVKLVSITVDPDRDKPEVLKQYAKRFKADESRWRFLTGDYAAIKQTADGMKLTIIAPKDNQAIDHDDHFLLIDRQGRVRGAYSGKDDDALNQLAKDAAKLAEAKG
jgi:protein SCO1/2